MLYDAKKWDKKTKNHPYSLESLLEWLETQNPATPYNYWDTRRCLTCQYLDAKGIEYHSAGGADFALVDSFNRQRLGNGWAEVVAFQPYTFGAALERARAYLAVERSRA